MYEILYCITHEEWFYNNCDVSRECVVTYSAPPELPDDWDEHLTPPAPDELAQMDVQALELVRDFVAEGI